MTSELVVGLVFGRLVEGKTTLSYICLSFHLPTHASQLTGTSSYYRFRCHYPLITYLTSNVIPLHIFAVQALFSVQQIYGILYRCVLLFRKSDFLFFKVSSINVPIFFLKMKLFCLSLNVLDITASSQNIKEIGQLFLFGRKTFCYQV